MLDLAFFIFLAVLIYWLLFLPYEYWTRKDVPGPAPTILLGNLGPSLFMKKNLALVYKDIYNEYNNYLYVGYYKFRKPGIIVRDIELIKNILFKDFASFYDNDIHVDLKVDPYFGNNPFCLKGTAWKQTRSLITSAITSSKIKNMFYLMTNVSKSMVEYLNSESILQKENGIEAKDLSTRFTTDVVASCAFGLEAGSFTGQSEFQEMGKKFIAPSFFVALRQMCLFILPTISKLFRVKFLSKEVEDWFVTVIRETIKYRETNNVNRQDYLDMLIGLRDKSGGNFNFTETDIIAQAVTFYTDGFETSAITLSHTLYELAENSDVQEKLRNDIESILTKYKGEVTYDAVQEMNYLDNCISEALRKHSPLGFMVRLCTKLYELPPPEGEGTGPKVILEPGTPVVIPVLGLHYDARYYPEPDKYDPDRFNDENKNSRPKATFLAFGEGPRICFGSKFGLAQTKAAIIGILRDFKISVHEKTETPLKLDPSLFLSSPIGGLWLNFTKRTDKNII